MFSTLLGALPAPAEATEVADPERSEMVRQNLSDLEATGLELLADGLEPAPATLDPETVVARWRVAAESTQQPVKQVLEGPYSAGRNDGPNGPAERAERLRRTVEALAAAGCAFIEVAEPNVLEIGVVSGERHRFVDAHRRLLAGDPATHCSLAVTGGDLDGAGPGTFFELAYASYAFDLIAGPDNWRLIAAAPGDRGIVCGALSPAANGDETREVLIWAAHYAASTGGRGTDRVGLANAPSLASLPREVALRKLGRVAEATRIAGAGSTEEVARLLDPRAFGRRRGRPTRTGSATSALSSRSEASGEE